MSSIYTNICIICIYSMLIISGCSNKLQIKTVMNMLYVKRVKYVLQEMLETKSRESVRPLVDLNMFVLISWTLNQWTSDGGDRLYSLAKWR